MSTRSKKPAKARTASHRPALKRRRFSHDDVTGGDLFSGFGGLTQGMERAGVDTIVAANHNPYKVDIHEANHPTTEHWICDLANPESSDYHSPRDLPAVDFLGAGISCVHHSGANAKRAYRQGLSLFSIEDEDYEARVTKSERDRATAVCVLQYADFHRPKMILVECTTELVAWGDALPNKPKIGDGSAFRWWLKSMERLDYRYRILYLNSMFFGVPQSRDRIYIAFWQKSIPDPDLDHRPPAWCTHCEEVIEAKWSWRTGVPPSGRVRYAEQYDYRCPSCSTEVVPGRAPAAYVIDWSDLGTKIGERERPLAPASMARIERCIQRFRDFPAVLIPAKSVYGVERHPWLPMPTQTSQQSTALLSTGALNVVAGHSFEHPGSECRTRDVGQPLWTQHATNGVSLVTPPFAAVVPYRQGTNPIDPRTDPMPTQGALEALSLLSAGVVPLRTHGHISGADEPTATVVAGAGSGGLGLVTGGVIPYRNNVVPTGPGDPMPTFTAENVPGLLSAGIINHNGAAAEAKYRARGVDQPFTGFTASPTHSLLAAGFFKQNGSSGDETAPHGMVDPLGTLTGRDTTGLAIADWYAMLDGLTADECYYRMMKPPEIGAGCGFDMRSFIVWGSAKDQVDGYGNAVSPPVGEWVTGRMLAVL